MSQTVTISGTITAGEVITIAKTHTSEHTHTRKFELAAGAVMELVFQSAIEGTALRFLYIRSQSTADLTQEADVSYGVSDAEASDPGNGTAWRAVNGLHLSWEQLSLSTANKLHIYNSGSVRATVTVIAGLDGA
jgi:hypothetical protein